MVDPIIEEELRFSRRMKDYEKFRKHIDEMHNPEKSDIPEGVGDMQGKKITRIESGTSQAIKIFKHTIYQASKAA